MYQNLTIVGNLGDDPQLRFTPSGVAVASFNLAVNKSWTNQDGQRQDKTTWFRVTAWRKQAEIVGQYLTKGRQVMVIGELEEARAYTPRDGGEPRASLEVTASIIKFLGQNDSAPQRGQQQSAPQAQTEEDIPF